MATSTSAVQASAWNPTTIFPQLGGLQFGGLPFELREQIYQDAINAVKLIKFKAVQTGEETLDNWGRYIPEYSMRLSSRKYHSSLLQKSRVLIEISSCLPNAGCRPRISKNHEKDLKPENRTSRDKPLLLSLL